jgi:hypothetical protein
MARLMSAAQSWRPGMHIWPISELLPNAYVDFGRPARIQRMSCGLANSSKEIMAQTAGKTESRSKSEADAGPPREARQR